MDTVQQFASKIKAKYPAYASWSDDDLARKMLDKFPTYKATVDTSTFGATVTPITTPVPEPGMSLEKYTAPLERAGERFKRVLAPTVLGRLTGSESLAGVPERALRTAWAAAGSAVDIPLSYALSGAKEVAQIVAPKPVETAVAEAGAAAGETLKEFYGGKAKKLIGAMPVAIKDWLKEQYGDAAYNANWSAILGLASLGGVGKGASAAKGFLTAEKTLAPEAKQAFVDLIERTSLDDIPDGEAKNLIKIIRGKNNTLAIEAPKSPIVTEPAPLGAAQQGVMREPGMIEKQVYNPATGKNEFRLVSEAPEAEAALNQQAALKSQAQARLAKIREINETERIRSQQIATGEIPASPESIPDRMPEAIETILPPDKSLARQYESIWNEHIKSGGKFYDWLRPKRYGAALKHFPKEKRQEIYQTLLKNADALDIGRSGKLTLEDAAKLQDYLSDTGVSISGNHAMDNIITIAQKAIKELKDEVAINKSASAILDKAINAENTFNKARRIFGQLGLALQTKAFEGDRYAMNLYKALDKRLNLTKNFGENADIIIEQLKAIDPKNPEQVKEFIDRNMSKFDKAKNVLQTYRYFNLLSAPPTHVVNIVGTGGTIAVLEPFNKLANASLDVAANIGSKLIGRPFKRTRFFAEVPAYMGQIFDRGAWKKAGQAFKEGFSEGRGYTNDMPPFWDAIKDEGERKIARQQYLSTVTKNRKGLGGKALTTMESVGGLLRGMDFFMRSLSRGGEYSALELRNSRAGIKMSEQEISEIAENKAMQNVFMEKLFPKNQGHVFDGLDHAASLLLKARAKGGVVGAISNMFAPFVTTINNVFKWSLDLTPIGFVDTALGVKKYKTSAESLKKAMDKIATLEPEIQEKVKQKLAGEGILIARTKEDLRDKLGRNVAGAIMDIYWMTQAADGKITLGAPDRETRKNWQAMNKKEYSWEFAPGKQISLSALGPFAGPAVFAGAYYNNLRKASNDKKMTYNLINNVKRLKAFLMASTVGMLDAFANTPATQALGTTVDLITGKEDVNKLVGQLSTQFVLSSSLQNYIVGMVDDFRRRPDAWYDYIRQRLPVPGPIGYKSVNRIPLNEIGLGSLPDEMLVKNKIDRPIEYTKRNLLLGGALGGLISKRQPNVYLLGKGRTARDAAIRSEHIFYGKEGSLIRKMVEDIETEGRAGE